MDLGVVMVYRCRFVSYNECTSLVRDITSQGGSVCLEKGACEKSLRSVQFCCEPKTAVKSKSVF